MRVGIVGSRGFPDRQLVERFVALLAKRAPDTIVVSGGARGVDTWAAEEARRQGLTVLEFLPDYDRYGRYEAPKERNTIIVDNSDKILAFWDGVSGGTMDTVRKAQGRGMKVSLIVVQRGASTF